MAKQNNSLPQLTQEEMTPPVIQPVPPGIKRPRWSVMIPTYNCARFLRETLESVLSQDIDPADMQIEVIDDCSTSDDPEAVVREFGQGRVSFYRQPKNVGATNNFNTCIHRSHGELIQILHGDDLILPGFYCEIEELDKRLGGAGLLAGRIFYCNEQGIYFHMTSCYVSPSPSRLQTISLMSDFNPFQFAGVVVRRDAFEHLGGFIQCLVHTADWEMWTRIASSYKIALTDRAFGVYRNFSTSDSSKLSMTAENLWDHARFEQIAARQGNAIDLGRLSKVVTENALLQARRFSEKGMTEAADASLQFWSRRVDSFGRKMITPRGLAKFLVRRAVRLVW
jgi:GT2 family glycosyltransferase